MKGTSVAALAGFFLTVAVSVGAQTDHLKCYKIKDPQAKATYTADLGGLTAEPGCLIKVPAKLACVPASKTNVTPPPPGTGGTGTPNTFGCYKVKCPKGTLPPLTLRDQFGSRVVTPSVSKMLCAPSAPATPFCVPLCSPDVCAGATTGCAEPCLNNTAGCFCVQTIEAVPACVQAICTGIPCADSASCGAGSVCFTEGCCG